MPWKAPADRRSSVRIPRQLEHASAARPGSRRFRTPCPFNRPASLSRSQSTDLAAFILQTDRFPTGQTALNEDMLAQVAFPAVQPPPARATTGAAGVALPPPEGNLAELMRAIPFRIQTSSSNLQVKDPGKQPKKSTTTVPFDYVEWGSTVYAGWLAVDQAAVALDRNRPAPAHPWTTMSERETGAGGSSRLEAVVANLVDAGKLAHREAQGEEVRGVRRGL